MAEAAEDNISWIRYMLVKLLVRNPIVAKCWKNTIFGSYLRFSSINVFEKHWKGPLSKKSMQLKKISIISSWFFAFNYTFCFLYLLAKFISNYCYFTFNQALFGVAWESINCWKADFNFWHSGCLIIWYKFWNCVGGKLVGLHLASHWLFTWQ